MKTFIATTVQTIEVTDIALISLKQKKEREGVYRDGCDQLHLWSRIQM